MKFEIYIDEAKQWRFRLKAKNGKIVAASGEGLKNKKDAVKIINSICDAIASGDFVIETEKKKIVDNLS